MNVVSPSSPGWWHPFHLLLSPPLSNSLFRYVALARSFSFASLLFQPFFLSFLSVVLSSDARSASVRVRPSSLSLVWPWPTVVCYCGGTAVVVWSGQVQWTWSSFVTSRLGVVWSMLTSAEDERSQ